VSNGDGDADARQSAFGEETRAERRGDTASRFWLLLISPQRHTASFRIYEAKIAVDCGGRPPDWIPREGRAMRPELVTQLAAPHARKFSNDMTSATSKANPFDKVPNELLDIIISFIPLNKSFSYKKDDATRAIHQIITLMHVSRQFRVAMIQHRVWHDIDFEFENLAAFPIPYKNCKHLDQVFPTKSRETIYQPVSRANLPIRIRKLCESVFGDPFFREYIKTKTRWTFLSMEVIYIVLAYLPTFIESAHTVILNLDGRMEICLLRKCKRLVRLNYLAQHNDILDSVISETPSLLR
jgi:hypothetical protein